VTRVLIKLPRSPLVPTGIAVWVPLKLTVLIAPEARGSERFVAHEHCHVHQAEGTI